MGRIPGVAYEPENNSFKVLLQGNWLEFWTSETLNVLHRIMEPMGVSRETGNATTVKHLRYASNEAKTSNATTAKHLRYASNEAKTEEPEAYMAPQFVNTQGTLNMPQELLLTKQQVDRGKAARRLHEALNHPGDTALSRTLMRGHIADTHITAKDIVEAEKILGPCPACKASKATLQVRGGQYSHADEIGQHLRCDIAFIGGRKSKTPFHFAVEEKCGHLGVEKLKTQTALSLFEAQMKQVNFYRARGFNPEKLFYDDCTNVQGTKYMLQEQRIILKQWPPGQHAVTEEGMVRQPYPSGIIQLINEAGDNDYDVDDLVVSAGSEENWQDEPYGDTAVDVI